MVLDWTLLALQTSKIVNKVVRHALKAEEIESYQDCHLLRGSDSCPCHLIQAHKSNQVEIQDQVSDLTVSR